MKCKVLCVDDDVNVLNGLQRTLRKQFHLETATSGDEALSMIDKQGPYAVVMADMRMPGMNGVQFLSNVRKKTPDSVRIMLTGNADLQTAADAVNQGHVYEFLTKPCAPETLAMALAGGIKQYEMVTAERDLLENTLAGSVKVLTEILSVVDPQLFGRGQQLREYMRSYIQAGPTESRWQLELAAVLAPIGYVTIPGAVTARVQAGDTLSDAEVEMLTRVPEFGSKLLANIPRLEPVAQIVLYQSKHFDGSGFPSDSCAHEDIPIGARILKVLNDLLDLEAKGMTKDEALQEMQRRTGWYDPRVLDAAFVRFDAYLPKASAVTEKGQKVTVHELRPGQILSDNVYTSNGVLIVRAGTRISPMLLERLHNFSRLQALREPLEVE
jgi:response regulator RpfG family c-di-GMP phosphodiesterase